jgi:hypothetical protein
VAQALSTIAFVTLFVLAAAAFLTLAHRALRPKEMHARSATALRELEPRGGRHRFHARLFEAIALTSACMSALGVLLVAAATPEAEPSVLVVGGGAVAIAVWWAWRRGALRTVEAEPRHSPPAHAAHAPNAMPAPPQPTSASARRER